jgi:phospholipid/cholesterol/gamma-HCH transport system substrate-binding protein
MNFVRRFLWIGVPLIALLVWVWLASAKHGWFDSQRNAYFQTDSASGVTVGMPVRLAGYRVGRVTEVSLLDSGKVQGRIAILERYQNLIKSDAELELNRDQIIGLATLDFKPFSSSQPLAEGARITLDRSSKVGDFAKQVTDRIDPVLQQLQVTLHSLDKRLNDPGLVATLSGSEQTVGNLNKTMVETQLTLKETRGSVSALQGNVNQLTQELTVMSKKSGALTEELMSLSQDVRDSWLIRGFFSSKKKKEETK